MKTCALCGEILKRDYSRRVVDGRALNLCLKCAARVGVERGGVDLGVEMVMGGGGAA